MGDERLVSTCSRMRSSIVFSVQFVEIHKLSLQIVTRRNIRWNIRLQCTPTPCRMVASKSVRVICHSAWQLWTLALSEWWDNLLNSLNSSSLPLAILMWLLPAQATQVHVQGTLCACECQNPHTCLFVLHCWMLCIKVACDNMSLATWPLYLAHLQTGCTRWFS